MYWVVQEDLYAERGHAALLRALQVLDLPHSVHAIAPGTLDLQPEVGPDGKVIVLGAYTMLRIAAERGWAPGAYVDQNFDFTAQLPRWGARLLNADAWVGPLRDAPPFEGAAFVRPTFDSKAFSGKIVDWHDFAAWRDGLRPTATLNPDTAVIVSPQKVIYGEYRTWIVGGRLVTASQYKRGSVAYYDHDVPDGILDFARDCAAEWQPASAFVLDVASTPDGLRIVEVNCINSAGWYEADVGAVVQALEDLESVSPP